MQDKFKLTLLLTGIQQEIDWFRIWPFQVYIENIKRISETCFDSTIYNSDASI